MSRQEPLGGPAVPHCPPLAVSCRETGLFRQAAPGASALTAPPLLIFLSAALSSSQALSDLLVSPRDTQTSPAASGPCRVPKQLAVLEGLPRGALGLVRLPPRVEAQPAARRSTAQPRAAHVLAPSIGGAISGDSASTWQASVCATWKRSPGRISVPWKAWPTCSPSRSRTIGRHWIPSWMAWHWGDVVHVDCRGLYDPIGTTNHPGIHVGVIEGVVYHRKFDEIVWDFLALLADILWPPTSLPSARRAAIEAWRWRL